MYIWKFEGCDSFPQFCEDGSFLGTRKEMKIVVRRERDSVDPFRKSGAQSELNRRLGLFCIFFVVFSLPPSPSLCLNNIYPRTRHSLFNGRVFAGNPSFLRTNEYRVFVAASGFLEKIE